MSVQQPLALSPPAGTADWVERVLVEPRSLRALAGLNEAFLALLFELHSLRPGQPALGLPAHLLPPPCPAPRAVTVLAELPCALFDLRFRDARCWQAQAARAAAVRDGCRIPLAEPALAAFTRAALTFAWHLAQDHERSARLLLGIEPATARVLVDLPVGALDALAHGMAPQLGARFCTREVFWGSMRDALRVPSDAARRERLRRLGLQLHGMDSARAQQLHRRGRRHPDT